ncbi:MAG: peptidoglycan-binding protein [Christensenellales bacterium]|jgi:cell wall-associated NlpC family hydrolase
MMKRLRIPLLTAGGVVLCAFVLIPMAFDTLDIGPEIVEVSKSMLHMPSPTPTAEVAENFAITAAAPKDAAEAPSKYRLLKLGDTDPVVADIHERLAELQYMDGDEPSEYFGEPIEAALKRFQRIHHMKETGEADELTQEMLFSDKAAMYKLQQGDEGEDVESLQERLQDLGYEVEKTNGYFGVATVKALSSFQKKNKLDATGVMDTDTADILYSNNARPKVDPTPSPTPKPKSTPTAKPAKTPKISATPRAGNESIGTTKTADPGTQPESTPKTGGGGSVSAATGSVDGFIATAMAQQGKPYITADEGPDSFDCSGLVYYCLSNNGVKVGRMSAKSYAVIDSWETVYSTSDLRPGDLLFFWNSGRTRIYHTGIWLGGGKYIHASSSAGQVVVSGWSDWAKNSFSHGKRVY